MKLDFIAMQQKRQKDENGISSSAVMKKEERDSVMMDEGAEDVRMHVKQEFLGDEGDAPQPNIRDMADTSGDFLKNINTTFGLTSPIQPSRDEIRAADITRTNNAYQHNMNLSLELQNIVNEHLMMEEYPAAEDYLAGLDRDMPIDMPLDFMGAA